MIKEVLEERGSRYGKFVDHAKIAQGLQEVLHQMPNWATMDYDMRQALVVITDKIARMGNGDPFYDDNWIDIIGYATLVLERIQAIPKVEQELFEVSKLGGTAYDDSGKLRRTVSAADD